MTVSLRRILIGFKWIQVTVVHDELSNAPILDSNNCVEPPAIASACNLDAHGDGLTVYFDGSCALCQREIALAKKMTGEDAVAYRDISDRDAGDLVVGDLTSKDAMARFHVRRADGSLASGAAAFLEMWTVSPRLQFLKPVAQSRIAVAALDRLYTLLLKVRPPLSRAVGRYDAWRRR